MLTLNLKPTHKAVKAYYDEISTLAHLDFYDEGAVSPAFAALLRHCGHQYNWTLVEKYGMDRGGRPIKVDGALVDAFRLPHGYWEAKDTKDDLEKEVQKKFADGYPKDNILFQAPQQAIIWRDGREYYKADLSQAEKLVETLKIFFDYQPPQFEEWEKAVNEFKVKLPELAQGLLQLIRQEEQTNRRFIQAFEDFAQLCRQALNPNLSNQAVEEMIIQHILTERIFRKVFNNPDFASRNIIAREIEKVIQALTSQDFSREEFLKSLDRFYLAIEAAAASIDDYTQKQSFLNTVYERFFQGFSVKVAKTHGIVYTPQPIVNFMVRSVDHLLSREFGRSLGDEGVHILDPFVGTGNFLVRIMREIPKTKLERKYASELHCNEVMLLPYYIASMNLEHCFYELTDTYRPFEGICLVDTFELAEAKQPRIFPQENLERVGRQQKAPIFVIIGNPPYSAGQVNENDNNKNRKYPVIDKRVSETYGKASKATLVRKLNDPYVKAIRWATDRIRNEGIVAFVTNSSFISEITFDGMREHLENDFDSIYILDLGGNVRKNPKLSGTTHNVFGIQPGVSINLLIKNQTNIKEKAIIFYARIDEWWRKEEKYNYLENRQYVGNIDWQEIHPDEKHNWLTEGISADFETLIPLGTKVAKRTKKVEPQTIFQTFSLGVSTNRDSVVYDFDKGKLCGRVKKFADDYNVEISRYLQENERLMKQHKEPPNIDNFVNYDKIQWSRNLKRHFKKFDNINFDEEYILLSIYRPFTKKYLYLSDIIIDELGNNRKFFPNGQAESENRIICVSQSSEKPFVCLIANTIPNLVMCGGFGSATQCFPFYIYREDGSNRQENLTDWALQEFRGHYQDATISKWNIFHYVYGVLQHPHYRQKYAANLRRELPRIPFAPDFWEFSQAGAALAELHVNYENQPEYPLTWVEKPGEKLDWRVEKMKISPDKTRLIYNKLLTLEGIPLEVFEYKLGNRSALEWVIDQYRVGTDKRTGIVTDPNRADAPQYIVRLIGRVITVSLETLRIIKGLPVLEGDSSLRSE